MQWHHGLTDRRAIISQLNWLWWWLLHLLSIRQSLSPITVHFRTTLNRTIILDVRTLCFQSVMLLVLYIYITWLYVQSFYMALFTVISTILFEVHISTFKIRSTGVILQVSDIVNCSIFLSSVWSSAVFPWTNKVTSSWQLFFAQRKWMIEYLLYNTSCKNYPCTTRKHARSLLKPWR